MGVDWIQCILSRLYNIKKCIFYGLSSVFDAKVEPTNYYYLIHEPLQGINVYTVLSR